jgi:hypothetical protein
MKQFYILNTELMLNFLGKQPLRRIEEKASWISPAFFLQETAYTYTRERLAVSPFRIPYTI